MPEPETQSPRVADHWTIWAVRPDTLPVVARSYGELTREGITQAMQDEIVQARRSGGGLSITKGVAVLPLKGLLRAQAPSFLEILFGGGGGLLRFRSQLAEAAESDDVEAIVLDVDSPGGSTDLIPEIAAEIRAVRGSKPIIAVANTFAASAAYWLAAQADELVVTPSGQVGSIGVFAVHDDWSVYNQNLGVQPTYISAGKFKTEGNPDEPLEEEARGAWQLTVDEFYEMFTADVASGRGVPIAKVKSSDFGEGRMVSAKRAVQQGMADRVQTLEVAVAEASNRSSSSARPIRSRSETEPKTSPKANAEDETPAPNEGTSEEEPASTPNSTEPPVDEEAAAQARRAAVDRMYAR